MFTFMLCEFNLNLGGKKKRLVVWGIDSKDGESFTKKVNVGKGEKLRWIFDIVIGLERAYRNQEAY